MKISKILTLATLSVASIMSSSIVFAASSMPYGWYVEGNAGSSRATNKTYGNATSTNGKGFGYNIDIGYKFIPYFAAEFGYTNYAKTVVKTNLGNAANDTHYSYDLAGKGILPINDTGLEVFAKLGFARSNSHTKITNAGNASGANIQAGTNSSSGVYIGLGGDYSVLTNLAVNAQWARAKGNNNVGYLDLYSVGLTWLFS